MKLNIFHILAFWVLLIGPGVIDGAVNPAAAPATLTRVEQDPDDIEWVIIAGKSVRLRPECNPRRLEWFIGERSGKNTPVDWDWGPPKIRTDGGFDFVDWRVRAAPPETLRNASFADVLHQCHFFGIEMPWLTRSRFYR